MNKSSTKIFKLIIICQLLLLITMMCGCASLNSGCSKRLQFKGDLPCHGQQNPPINKDLTFYNTCLKNKGNYFNDNANEYCSFDKCFCSNSPPEEWKIYSGSCLEDDNGLLIIEKNTENGQYGGYCRYIDPSDGVYTESPCYFPEYDS